MTHGKEKVCAFSQASSRRCTAASRGTFRPLRIRPCVRCARRIAFYERLGFSRGEGLYYYLFYRPLADPRHPDAAPAAGAALSRLTGSKISSF